MNLSLSIQLSQEFIQIKAFFDQFVIIQMCCYMNNTHFPKYSSFAFVFKINNWSTIWLNQIGVNIIIIRNLSGRSAELKRPEDVRALKAFHTNIFVQSKFHICHTLILTSSGYHYFGQPSAAQ